MSSAGISSNIAHIITSHSCSLFGTPLSSSASENSMQKHLLALEDANSEEVFIFWGFFSSHNSYYSQGGIYWYMTYPGKKVKSK